LLIKLFCIFVSMDSSIPLYSLLRVALGAPVGSFAPIDADGWRDLYNQADRQTLLGLIYSAVEKLPAESRPPLDILFQWSSEVETIKGLNRILNAECVRLTELFDAEGRSTVILKGQANARLYPDPLCRQPGDIDIWVSGGKKQVLNLLRQRGLLDDSCGISKHHAHMKCAEDSVDVEVHFLPSSGNCNPITTKRLLHFLNGELENRTLIPEGFYIPSCRFALLMQLSHIQRHYYSSGVGLRQLVDYYLLLKNASAEDLKFVSKKLNEFGLFRVAGAVMWVLQEVLGLDEKNMICRPDVCRGKMLLNEIVNAGNFGMHRSGPRLSWLFWWLRKRGRNLRKVRFNFSEAFFGEIFYWIGRFESIPERIKLRRLSLRNPHETL